MKKRKGRSILSVGETLIEVPVEAVAPTASVPSSSTRTNASWTTPPSARRSSDERLEKSASSNASRMPSPRRASSSSRRERIAKRGSAT